MITTEQIELNKKYNQGVDGGVRLIAIDADLSDADLSDADLSDADLSGADLRRADLSGAIGLAPVTEDAIAAILQIAGIVLADHDRLEMSEVHECETTHCGAGWVCHLLPMAGALEKILGWNAAACIAVPVPEFTGLFYSTNEKMIDFLESVQADQGAALRAKYL